jgi:multiple sugar transport system substrate-binding protein
VTTKPAARGPRRPALWLAIGLAAAAGLVGAFELWRSSREPITLTFSVYSGNNWGVPAGAAYAIYDEAKAMFEARPENRGIRIKLITGTLFRDYSEWFAQLALKGREPDIFMVKDEDFNVLASVGIMEDLGSYISGDPSFRAEAFYPKALEAGVHSGGQYSLPISVVPSFLIVNRTLLKREGIAIDRERWDWDQFYRICRSLTKDADGDGAVDQFGVYGYTWQDAFYTNGQTLFSPDGSRVVFEDQAMIETLANLKRIFDLNRGATISESDFDRGRAGFKEFNLAEYRAYGSYPYRILKYSDFEWEILPFPSGPRGHSISKLYTVQVGMSSRSRHKAEAFRFLEFLASDKRYQRQIWLSTNVLPADRELVAELRKAWAGGENDARLLDFLENNRIMENLYVDPAFKWYADMNARINDRVFQIVAGNQDIERSVPILRREIGMQLASQK